MLWQYAHQRNAKHNNDNIPGPRDLSHVSGVDPMKMQKLKALFNFLVTKKRKKKMLMNPAFSEEHVAANHHVHTVSLLVGVVSGMRPVTVGRSHDSSHGRQRIFYPRIRQNKGGATTTA